MLSRYEAVLSALDAGVVIHAADTEIVEANDRARDLLGIQDLEGRLAVDPAWVFLESDHTPMALERFPVMQVIASAKPVVGLLMIVRPPAGSDVWLEVNACPVLDESGQLQQIAVTFIDVTDRSLATKAVEEKAQRLELVLESAQLGLWDWNMVTGETVFDERWAQIVGYRLEELEPVSIQTWIRLSHPDDLAESNRAIEDHVKGLSPLYDAEVRMRHRDGHWVWVRDRGKVVKWSADGQPLRMAGTHEDVSQRHADAERLAASEELLRVVLDTSRDTTIRVGLDDRVEYVNQRVVDISGVPLEQWTGKTFAEMGYPTELAETWKAYRRPVFETGEPVTFEFEIDNTEGHRWYETTVAPEIGPDGTITHVIETSRDITDRVAAEGALRTSQAQLLQAQRIAHVGSWTLDTATNEETWSGELLRIHGLDPTGPAPDVTEQQRLFTPESWQALSRRLAVAQDTGAPYELELEMVRPDGSHGWVLARGEALRDEAGDITGLGGVALDITERKSASDQLQMLATHDPLTGLANRAVVLDEITRAVSAGQRSGRATAVLMMDLDRFKNVNDTLGHAAGDELLIAAAARMQEIVRASDLVARLGGDEFVVAMRDLDDPTEAIRAAWRMVESFRTPLTVSDVELYASASVGVTITTDSRDADDLMREADTAMYKAKAEGRDRVAVFNEDLRVVVSARLAVERDLRQALDRGELEVWYQPEVDLATGRVVAVEALLRWHHPDGTVWTADRFIDVAEDTGLILDIGDWTLRQACAQAAAWAAARPDRPMIVRVNISAFQLAETGLLLALDEALDASGLDPTLLCIEITETALLRQTAAASANLAGVHERGVSVAIDDFGTGYASLIYLRRYPIDVIKIDRNFVTNLTTDPRDRAIVSAVITLANALRMTVTAEGVEHPDQATQLLEAGCPSAQGWLYSQAVAAEEATALLDRVLPMADPSAFAGDIRSSGVTA